MNNQLFEIACEAVKSTKRAAGGIGTLGERTLHIVLKQYFEPDESRHEIKVGRYVADIVRPDGIIEIQTRDFNKLRGKLAEFLEMNQVTVVYPIAVVKRLRWIDMQTGEISPPRKSPKRGMLYDALPELYKIKQYVTHPNFRLCLAMLDLEELRYLNGWSADGKRGSERCDRIPIELLDEIYFHSAGDYRKMLPEMLALPFRTKDFKAATGLGQYNAGLAVNTLKSIGAINVVAREKQAFVYG